MGREREEGAVRFVWFLPLFGALVAGVDAAPTVAQATETELALKEWSEIGADWQRLRDDDVAALNRELDKVRLPRLRDGLEPPRDLDFADEE